MLERVSVALSTTIVMVSSSSSGGAASMGGVTGSSSQSQRLLEKLAKTLEITPEPATRRSGDDRPQQSAHGPHTVGDVRTTVV
jgi:hypothetical protein